MVTRTALAPPRCPPRPRRATRLAKKLSNQKRAAIRLLAPLLLAPVLFVLALGLLAKGELRPRHLTEAALAERLERLRPAIERELGAPLPPIKVRAVAEFDPVADSDPPHAWGQVPTQGPGAGEIQISERNLLRLAAAYPRDDLEMLDGILIHGAVHAYQLSRLHPDDHRHATQSCGEDAVLGNMAALEGHACLASRAIASRLDLDTGSQWLATRWEQKHTGLHMPTRPIWQHQLGEVLTRSDHRMIYVDGEAFVRQLSKRLGPETALRRLLNQPPIGRYDVGSVDIDAYLSRTSGGR